MRLSFAVILMLAAQSVRATEKIQFYSAIGVETRLEKTQDQNSVDRRLQNISLGVSVEEVLLLMEFSSFNVGSSSGSVAVDRKVENRAAAAYVLGSGWLGMNPILGAGLGYSSELIDTTLAGIQTRDVSRPNYFIFGAVGARLDVEMLWLSVEVRVFSFERSEPNPTAGLLGKIGFQF